MHVQLVLIISAFASFRMSFRDFSANFQRLEICNLDADDVTDFNDDDVTFQCQQLHGAWKKNVNAGGCRNFMSKNKKNSNLKKYFESGKECTSFDLFVL